LEGKDTCHPVSGVGTEENAVFIDYNVVVRMAVLSTHEDVSPLRVDGAGEGIVIVEVAEEDDNSSFKGHLISPKRTRRERWHWGRVTPGGPQRAGSRSFLPLR
jgi:hypothetical protein